MIPEHGQTGSALAVHVDGVDRHDDGLRLSGVRHQDADPAIAEADRIVRHPEGKKPSIIWTVGSGVGGQGSGVPVSPGASVLVQVDPAGQAGGLRPDSNRHCVKGHLGVILLHPGAEGGGQSEGGVGVDLSEVGVLTGT